MKKAINLAVISNKKILLVKKRETWIFPGGKLGENELDADCLRREFREELSDTEIIIEGYYNSFIGITPHSGKELEAKVYLGKIKGEVGRPSSEISDAKFINDFENYNISELTSEIIKSFKEGGYL